MSAIRGHLIYATSMLAAFVILGPWMAPASAAPTLVRDVNPGTASSTPERFANIGHTLLFRATDTVHGAELWRSNGTAAGTHLVKDINPGSAGSDPYAINNAGGKIFFRATDPAHGAELWVSDGTAAGTHLVKDINPGSAGSDPDSSRPGHLSSFIKNLGGKPFFVAYDPAHGYELWTSNGTATGTHRVKDIFPGATSSRPMDPTIVGGTVFFGARDPAHGAQLWATNGKAAGTRLVTNLHPAYGGLYPNELTEFAGRLVFVGASRTKVSELWTSDADGTRRVDPTGRESDSGNLTNVGGTLFFAATDSRGRELWRSDGSAAGTRIVEDINKSIEAGSNGSYPNQLTDVAGTLYFVARDASHGGLWRSDGTAAGTRLVYEHSRLSSLMAVGSTIFFVAFNFTRGYGPGDLWKSDGTPAGTQLVKTWPSGDRSALRNVLGTLFFTAYDRAHGYELWKYRP